jgi:hypothetical protein
LATFRAHSASVPSKSVSIHERNAMLATLAILMAGCFVICGAVLLLASATDGRRKAAVLLARTGAAAHRPGRP